MPVTTPDPPTDDPWAAVVGQPEATAQLAAALAAPVHAYLFVGRPGRGSAAAARVFAGELLAARDTDHAARHRRLASGGQHPAVWEVVRTGASISAEDAREVVRRAGMSPPEGTLQVIILHELHLVGPRAPILLKTIEEPPPSTLFIALADEVLPDLVTIASRCVRVDFPPIPAALVESALVAEGVASEVAADAARSSGGDLDRARLLVTDPELSARRRFWLAVPGRLDGTGSTVAVLVDEARARIDAVMSPLAERAAAEAEALGASYEALGSVPAGVAKETADRHKREQRQVRTDELRAGFAGLLEAYRDAVAAGAVGAAAAYSQAATLVQRAAEDLVRNPTEALMLQALFVSLPPLSSNS